MLPIPIEQIIQYANFGFIAIIIICAIVGFVRGTLKSSYFMVVTLLILVFTWILMGTISQKCLYLDLSGLSINIDGIALDNPMGFVEEFISINYPDYAFMFTENTQGLSLVEGIVSFALKLILFCVSIVLMFTVYYLIFGLVWLIAKYPLRALFAKKNENGKYKKTFISRIIGTGIGATKGLIYVLLIGIILAGVASISKSFQEVTASDTEVAVVCVNDTFTVIQLNNSENSDEDSLDDYEEIFDLINGYYDTIPGKIFGSIKYGENENTIDELLFDSLFTISTDNGNLKLRNELRTLSKILTNDAVKKIMVDGFDIKKLYQLEKEDLTNLIDEISKLETIKVLSPVGLELVAYTDILQEALGTEYESIKQMIMEKLPELVELDYCQEVKNLGYVFVDVVELLGDGLENPEKLDYFNFNQETIDSIFENLEKLNLIEVVAPITINYLLNSESVKEAILKTGFTIEDLGLNESVDYVKELDNLPKLYETFVSLGIKNIDGELDLSAIDLTKIEGFVEVLFDSQIISNAIPVVATTLVNVYMPQEFAGILSKEELNNTNWEQEFSPLLKAAGTLLKTGILTAEDKYVAISNLSDENINELGLYLSGSTLIKNNLNDIIQMLLNGWLSNVSKFEGIAEWNQTEIISLFSVVKEISKVRDFQFTDSELEQLAENMCNSTYIKKNLNSIINAFVVNQLNGIEIANLSEDEWTVNEIFSTFKAVNIIMNSSNNNTVIETVLQLTEEDFNVILESRLIKESIIDLLIKESQPGNSLSVLKGIYADGINETGLKLYSWNDETIDVQFEIINGILNIKHTDNVIQYNIYKNGRYFASTKDNLNVTLSNENYSYSSNDSFKVVGITEKGELRKLVNVISLLNITDFQKFDFDLKIVLDNKYSMLSSYIVTETVIATILSLDINNPNGVIAIPDDFKEGGTGEWRGEYGELISLIDAIDAILDIRNIDEPVTIDSLTHRLELLYIHNLGKNMDAVLKSKLLSATIINKIQVLSGKGIVIPEKYINNNDLWYSEYQEGNLIKHNELAYLLKALCLILPEDSNLEVINISETVKLVLQLFKSTEKAETLLTSGIICENLKENILSLEVLKQSGYVQNAFRRYGKDYNDSYEWYELDANGKPVRGELWNLINGVSLLLGLDSIDDLEEFTIELLLNNPQMEPQYNDQCEITSSNIEIILESIVIEEIFAGIAINLTSDGSALSKVLNVPVNPNWYKKDVGLNEEYDLQTFLESYFILTKVIDFNNILDSYTSLKTLSQDEIKIIGTGMVSSRIFRSNISNMFNAIFGVQYAIESFNNPSMVKWDTVKFNQADYSNVSKLQARTKFVQTYNRICDELNK